MPRHAVVLVVVLATAPVAAQSPPPATVRVVTRQALGPLAGERVVATLIEVSYPPGGASTPHSHPCPVVGYVIWGALRSQVTGDSVRIFRAGDSFFEPARGVHAVSANASNTEPVKFLAWFTCDGSGPLSQPVGDTATAGH